MENLRWIRQYAEVHRKFASVPPAAALQKVERTFIQHYLFLFVQKFEQLLQICAPPHKAIVLSEENEHFAH